MGIIEAVISTIVDNEAISRDFKASWGLSFHVHLKYGDGSKHEVLFDVSGDYGVWHYNASKLGIKPSRIESIVISHWHADHAGILTSVLNLIGRSIPVYAPTRIYGMKEVKLIACKEPCEVYPGVRTSGVIGWPLKEQALAINVSGLGPIVLVGCSHPGVVEIAKRIMELEKAKVYAIMGGFHISTSKDGRRVGEGLVSLDVKYIAPMHCTSIEAKNSIKEVVGTRYLTNAAGRIIRFSSRGLEIIA